MPGLLLTLRRRLLTPSYKQTNLQVRGFRIKNPKARDTLETAGRSFLDGFAHAAGTGTPAAAERRIETMDGSIRGFAYEGAAMAYALMAGLGIGDRRAEFLAGPGQRHIYMAHVGFGWALARLPRFRRAGVFPSDPLLRWLALDGYGFHQAYFRTDQYVHRQHRDPLTIWDTELRGYAPHAVDQGVGRALWFVGGADVHHVLDLLGRFAADRHADLFSGVGLAATYAGGVDGDDLEVLRRSAGPHLPVLCQGSAFAAQARRRAGLTTSHTEQATSILCSAGSDRAATVTDEALRDLPPDGPLPAYAVWRQRIAAAFPLLERY